MSDGWSPVSDAAHAAQVAALTALVARFGERPRVLDLGAGDGRLALPLLGLGCDVVAVDSDEAALSALRAKGARAVRGDFIGAPGEMGVDGPFDAVVCMGNTFCLVHDVERAAELVRWIAGVLAPGGVFVIDDIVSETWADVAEGNWQSGVSEDGSMQLVWAEGDDVVAIREGDAVDEESWAIGPGDRAMRLWSWGSLGLLARAAGMAGPRTDASGCLIVFAVTRG